MSSSAPVILLLWWGWVIFNYSKCFFIIYYIGAPLWWKLFRPLGIHIHVPFLQASSEYLFFFFFAFKNHSSLCLSWFSVYIRGGGIKGQGPVLASNGPQPSPWPWPLVQGGGHVSQAERIRTNEGQAKDFCWNFWERFSTAVAKL